MEMPPRLAGQAGVLRHRAAEIQLLLARHKPRQTHRTEPQAETLVTKAEAAGKGLSKRQVAPVLLLPLPSPLLSSIPGVPGLAQCHA